MRRLVILLTIGMSAPPPSAAAAAQDSAGRASVAGYDATRAQRLYGELMSPFCPGLTLATCPSPGADSLRHDIRSRLAHGQSPRSIRAAYAAVWGEQILGAPRWRGWGIVLWLAPAVVLAAGAAALAMWLARLRARGRAGGEPAGVPPREATAPPLDERMRKRLEEELAARDVQ
jgi:cytochrome c-type biogenesis protein CcmH/NrfF